MHKPRTPSRVSAKWRKILALIPGYDCFATAEPGDRFDEKSAQRACDFFPECLKHVEGPAAGTPFELQPWQQALIGCLFGWKRIDDAGREVRRYRRAFILVGKKNGKTPLAAGICNYVLFCDNEPGAQIYSAACEREQAALLYRHARGMVEREPELASRAKIYAGTGHRSITLRDDPASSYKVLSADADSKDGQNPHLTIIDEIHRFKSRDLVDCLAAGFISKNRSQPLLIYITTADWMRPSICNEQHDYARDVRDGKIPDSRYLPVLYETQQDEDWKDEAVWRRANPNLGVSVSIESLREMCIEAQHIPAKENTFRRLYLNQRTEQDERWLPMEAWDACRGNVGDLAGKVCYAGLDVGATSDLTAVVLVFPEFDYPWPVLSFFWCTQDTAARRDQKSIHPYSMWARQGHMYLTPGSSTDYDYIRNTLADLAKRYNIAEVAMDVGFQGIQISNKLSDDGFTVIEHRQGIVSMAGPCKAVTEMILSRKYVHDGNPVMRWNFGNVAVSTDAAGNIKFDKGKASDKIDGMVALAMATGRALANYEHGSVYDREGVMAI